MPAPRLAALAALALLLVSVAADDAYTACRCVRRRLDARACPFYVRHAVPRCGPSADPAPCEALCCAACAMYGDNWPVCRSARLRRICRAPPGPSLPDREDHRDEHHHDDDDEMEKKMKEGKHDMHSDTDFEDGFRPHSAPVDDFVELLAISSPEPFSATPGPEPTPLYEQPDDLTSTPEPTPLAAAVVVVPELTQAPAAPFEEELPSTPEPAPLAAVLEPAPLAAVKPEPTPPAAANVVEPTFELVEPTFDPVEPGSFDLSPSHGVAFAPAACECIVAGETCSDRLAAASGVCVPAISAQYQGVDCTRACCQVCALNMYASYCDYPVVRDVCGLA